MNFSNQGYETGIAILDIDFFKKVNDNFGHDVGDKVLIQFVRTVKKHIREEDLLVRRGTGMDVDEEDKEEGK